MSPTRRRWLVAGVGGLAAMMGGALAWRRWTAAEDRRAADALWTMRFQRPEGSPLVMADFRGKPLVINFWATWCAPCVRELPALQRFQREHAAQGWRVIALAVDQPVPVIEFVNRYKLDLTVAMAGPEGLEWQRAMGNDSGGLPFSIVLDAQGRVLHRRLGESHFDELVRWAGQAPPS